MLTPKEKIITAMKTFWCFFFLFTFFCRAKLSWKETIPMFKKISTHRAKKKQQKQVQRPQIIAGSATFNSEMTVFRNYLMRLCISLKVTDVWSGDPICHLTLQRPASISYVAWSSYKILQPFSRDRYFRNNWKYSRANTLGVWCGWNWLQQKCT